MSKEIRQKHDTSEIYSTYLVIRGGKSPHPKQSPEPRSILLDKIDPDFLRLTSGAPVAQWVKH